MITLRSLSQAILQHAAAVCGLSLEALTATGATVSLIDPNSPHTGDVTTNVAMTVARALKQPPRAIAEKIIASLSLPTITHAEIAGPGFINLTIAPSFWQGCVAAITEAPATYFKQELAITPSSYLIEFVSANPTGPLHLGHGRNAIIGDVLATVLQYAGHTVQREFYINDAGNQMAKLGESLKARCQELSGIASAIPEEGYHGEYLIEIARHCIEQHGTAIVEQPISFFTQYAKEALLAQQAEELKEYGVTMDSWFSELSLHRDGSIDHVLTDLQKRGYLYEKDGALWFQSTAFGDDKDRVIRKADGALTYIAPDIAYHAHKFSRGFARLIDIVGQDHHGYILRLKGTLTALGYNADHLDVILYQLVSLKQGEAPIKMSKRSGQFVGLHEVIETVGVDAARFFFLHKKADAHLEIDIDIALKKTQENPVFYLQYAYVRTVSIAEKAASAGFTPQADAAQWSTSELLVIKKILSLTLALKAVCEQYATHTLAVYALDLAQTFHAFYTNNRIIDDAQPAITQRRLALVTLVHHTLGLTLDLLGLSRPTRM